MAKPEIPEPARSAAEFSQRCKSLAVHFGARIGLQTGDLAFAPEINSTIAVMTLSGRASETILRNRGRSHRVVPLAVLSSDVFIWTGYRESWLKHALEQKFRFVEAGFTLHLGRPGELSKPQILRSEWVGRRSRAFVEMAGHPHWQLDVLESARIEPSTALPVRFDDPPERQISVEFDSAELPTEASNILRGLTIENMHLASAAQWWKLSGAHVEHVPENVADLDRWVLGCVSYLRQESARCKITGTEL